MATTRSVTIIAGTSDLRMAQRALKRLGGIGSVEFRLPRLTDAENRNLTAVINGYGNACGCDTGGLAMSAGFTGIVIHYFASGGTWAAIGVPQWLWLGGATAVFALLGKLAGLMWARWRMISVFSNLRRAE